MQIALLAPLPPEQNGIADYAGHLKQALEDLGVRVRTPLLGIGNDPQAARQRVAEADWQGINLVHAEIGGGRLAEFHALRALRQRFPHLPLTATVHDPERLVWRRQALPWPLSLAASLRSPLPEIATVLADPLCLHEERQLARQMTRLITLTQTGNRCLQQRMGLRQEQMAVIAHGNLPIAPLPLPPLRPLKLLYFGFIYRGKGIEDLLEALARLFVEKPGLRARVRLTLAGGSEPEMAFGASGSYLEQLRQ
ncbi:MAG TPA: glycosyl transferase family 1, partial [Pseudomonas sp.]|nr:glycosyl transferase family 1 [Pseudomonas sp.]